MLCMKTDVFPGAKTYLKIEYIHNGIYSVKIKNYPFKIPHSYYIEKDGYKFKKRNMSTTMAVNYTIPDLKRILKLTDKEIKNIDKPDYTLIDRYSHYLLKKYSLFDVFNKLSVLKNLA